MSEIDAFPRAVLAHHYPRVPLHGDFTTIRAGQYEPIDLLVGGTPCQSFSVAGLRGGLADERGNLALEFLRLVQRLCPRWVVWENVPGVLSATSHNAPDPCSPPHDMAEGSEWVGEDEYDADEDHAFSCFLAGLSEIGYGWAYRSFDAQFFGLAQRRERVFVVGYLGDWRRAASVLFEPESLRGNTPPRREAGEGAAPTLSARTKGGGGVHAYRTNAAGQIDCQGDKAAALTGMSDPCSQFLAFGGNNTSGPIDVATACNAKGGSGRMDFESEVFVTQALRGEGFDASEGGTGRGTPVVPVSVALRGRDGGGSIELGDDLAYALRSSQGGGDKPHVLAFSAKDSGADAQLDLSPTLRAGVHYASHASGGVMPAIQHGIVVRRLTPRECERLQGFRDDYTLVPYRGSLAADGPRYKALGNSMAVPVMSWIGRRISMAEKFGGSDVAHETGDVCRKSVASSDAQLV